MASKRNGTIYTGATSNLVKRVWEHKTKVIQGFTNTYYCKLLVWYELCETMPAAYERERQIKGWLRKKKIALIEAMNPQWIDLYEEVAT